ncbi:glycosyl transferase [Acidihalobacter aeolianus]|uniref:Glycosyl transferase n=1 Tax=Acidihalobacter aeolianus TaxID=2792603 RepID=A0A1D8K949_9GAMM|nr:glycosyltransferase [Acidihalobacter aeolianus]AOV17455.1 glycosyl transferase [Acidihalobacter aeolianus]
MIVRLGDYLVAQGTLAQQDLDYALQVQTQSGERLGEILLALSLVKREDLYQALSTLWGMPYLRLDDEACATTSAWPLDEAVSFRAVVLGESDGRLRVATAELPGPELAAALAAHYPDVEPAYWVTTHWDIDRYLRRCYRQIILERSVYGLYTQHQEVSAYTVLTVSQYVAMAVLIVGGFLALVQHPTATLIGLNVLVTLFFFVNVVFKFGLGMAGAFAENDIDITDEQVAELQDDELPFYTVLVPVYREAGIVNRVMEHVAALDYPSAKLEILILIEEDDDETWDAALLGRPPDFVHLVRIPHALPKTKPKACNVGLSFARGEYLVIYDAEDIPDPDQLKKVLVAFREGPENLVCVQAALNYFNADENWLTRMFTLEYSYWFDYMLPGLQKLRLPIPLGGTSNHFRVDRLRELAGWDPFNVTEDADLGIRATALGYRVGIVNSTTMEEANNHIPNWIRQRSRWIKGYMQTALVHGRHPLRLLRSVGLKQALGFALLIGGTPVAFLAYLPTVVLYFIWLATDTHALDAYFPSWVLYVGLFNLLVGNAFGIYLSMLAVFKRRLYGLLIFSLTNPFYWLLHSVAAYKGLWQLMTRPFYWEKTHHGLSKSKSVG